MSHIARLAAPLVAAVALALPATAQASVVGRVAGLDTGGLAQFDQVNEGNGSVAAVTGDAYTGTTSALATFRGGQSNGYARGLFAVDWTAGDDVWYRAAYFLPTGFKTAMQGQVALLRWDNWVSHPTDTDHGGVVIYGSDKRARLVKERLTVIPQTDLAGAFDVPEGRWFLLEVHQGMSSVDGSAVNEVYLDGTRVARSTAANLDAGRSVERIRFGIVAIHGGRQANALSLRFDDAAVATSGPAAPRAGTPAPVVASPAPAPVVTTPAPAPAPAPATPAPGPVVPAPATAPTPAPTAAETSKTSTMPSRTCTKTVRRRVGRGWVTTKRRVACRAARTARKPTKPTKATKAGKARKAKRAQKARSRDTR